MKNVESYNIRKIFIIVFIMSNDTLQIMTYQQRYYVKKRRLEKGIQYYKKTNEGNKKWLVINTSYCLKKKIKIQSMVEINIRIPLKKTKQKIKYKKNSDRIHGKRT